MNIKTHVFDEDIIVYCKKATSFPEGVKQAFQYMHGLVDFDPARMQIGWSEIVSEDEMNYWAGSQEIVDGEFAKHCLETKTIQAGMYFYIPVTGYMQNIPSIGQAFGELSLNANVADKDTGLEWYLSMEEVWCMMKSAD